MNNAYNGVLPKQLFTSVGCRVMHLGGQIILLHLDLHLVIQSNLIVTEGQSSEFAIASKNSDIASEPRRTISSRLNKIKDFSEFSCKVEPASTVDFSNKDFRYF